MCLTISSQSASYFQSLSGSLFFAAFLGVLFPRAGVAESGNENLRQTIPAVATGEYIEWFPALATPERGYWKVTFSGLVTEDKSRPATSWLARRLLGFSDEELGSDERAIFRERTQRFLADDETGKRMQIAILDKRYDFGRTGRNGHFGGTILVPEKVLHPGQQSLPCVVFANHRAYTNAVPISAVGSKGISVVSDIDDTVKISDVRNRDELMRNTFLRPFRAVEGLPEVYRQWSKNSDAQFHYVSGSPWQLLPSLQDFIETNRFPAGSWHLRTVRLLGLSAMELRKSPDLHKRKNIEELFARLPGRRFVLVGDSGERDPEIYGDLARRNPKAVLQIFIRDVTGEAATSARYVKAFKGLPRGSFLIFKSADQLPQKLGYE